jgi:hypothetical protein
VLGGKMKAITYQGRPGQVFGPFLIDDADERFANNRITVLKEYDNPYTPNMSEYAERIVDIETEFDKDFPIDCEIRRSSGWISPAGKFYPCPMAEHFEYAIRLTAIYYDTFEGERRLEKEGWWKVYYNGVALNAVGSYECTQKQLDTLGALAILDEGWQRQLMDIITIAKVK